MKIELSWMPLVPVRLNGTGPYLFAVDTGYLGSCVSPGTADALGLTPDEHKDVHLESFEAGDLCFKGFTIFVSDNPKLWELMGERVVGILGMDFLKYYEFSIDYPRSSMSLTPLADLMGKRFVKKPDMSYVRLKYPNRYLVVPVYVDEVGPCDFLLDTGAKTTVVSEGLADRLGLARGEHKLAHGAMDDKACREAGVGALRVGDRTVHDLDVRVTDCAEAREYAEWEIDGYLGFNFLKRFAVTVNVPDLYLGLAE